MQTYLDKLKLQVGNAWRTDEFYVKINGNMKYLYALMDDETRFWIAQQVSGTKYPKNVDRWSRALERGGAVHVGNNSER